MKNHLVHAIIIFFSLIVLFGCAQNGVLAYLDNVEMQFEESQKDNIICALNDAITLSVEDLKLKRYEDYSGKKEMWDLPTVFLRHFFSDKQRTLGDSFYMDLKDPLVQNQIREILAKLKP